MIIQLHPDMPGHWNLYERFEKRCVALGEKTGWPLNAEHLKEMRQRFVMTPKMCGYFIADSLDAHVLGWCLLHYGQLGVLIYQCEGPRGESRVLLNNFFEVALPAWMNTIAVTLKRELDFIEFNVEEDIDDAWIRLLSKHHKVAAGRPMRILRLEATRAEAKADPIDELMNGVTHGR